MGRDVCPGNDESAGKRRSGKTTKGGSKWLGSALTEAAHAAACTKGSYLSAQYARIKRRGGPIKGRGGSIPAVMQGNLPETLKMVKALEDYPATAVLVLPPYYFKPITTEGLKRFYEPVLEASHHPIIIYHIPKYAVPVSEEVVARLPVWGVKYSEGDPATLGPSSKLRRASWSGLRTTSGRS